MIFISYRRVDSAAFAGRIADFFANHYEHLPVFLDISSIDPGEDFTEAITKRLAASKVALVIIGGRWLERDDLGNRRIDDPDDIVRKELATALKLNLRVIPVLLDDTKMPSEEELPSDLKPLANRNAEHIRGIAFQRDVEHLGKFVANYIGRLVSSINPLPKISADVRAELVKAFEAFRDFPQDKSFLICEIPSGQYVQFCKTTRGHANFDLPSEALTTQEMSRAQLFLTETFRPGQIDPRGDHFSILISLPLEPSFLSYFSMTVFENIFRITPTGPLKTTMETFS